MSPSVSSAVTRLLSPVIDCVISERLLIFAPPLECVQLPMTSDVDDVLVMSLIVCYRVMYHSVLSRHSLYVLIWSFTLYCTNIVFLH